MDNKETHNKRVEASGSNLLHYRVNTRRLTFFVRTSEVDNEETIPYKASEIVRAETGT